MNNISILYHLVNNLIFNRELYTPIFTSLSRIYICMIKNVKRIYESDFENVGKKGCNGESQ